MIVWYTKDKRSTVFSSPEEEPRTKQTRSSTATHQHVHLHSMQRVVGRRHAYGNLCRQMPGLRTRKVLSKSSQNNTLQKEAPRSRQQRLRGLPVQWMLCQVHSSSDDCIWARSRVKRCEHRVYAQRSLCGRSRSPMFLHGERRFAVSPRRGTQRCLSCALAQCRSHASDGERHRARRPQQRDYDRIRF